MGLRQTHNYQRQFISAITNGEKQLPSHKTGSIADVTPSAEVQRRVIAALEQQPVGVYCFFVATEWYEQWQLYVGSRTQHTSDTIERPGKLMMYENGKDVTVGITNPIVVIPGTPNTLVDEKMWWQWVEWYGVADSHPLDRHRQINSSLVIFEVCMLRSYNMPVKHPKKSFEITEECGYIEMQLRRMSRVSADRKTRLWVCEKSTDERFQLMSDRTKPINVLYPQLSSQSHDAQLSVRILV